MITFANKGKERSAEQVAVEQQPVAVVQLRPRVRLLTLAQIFGGDDEVVAAETEARRRGKKLGEARVLLDHPMDNVRLAAEAGASVSNGDPDFIAGVVEGEQSARRRIMLAQAGQAVLFKVVSKLRRKP